MCILKEVGRFIKNGASTFRDASQGHYKQNSEAISEIRKEILEKTEIGMMIREILWKTEKILKGMYADLSMKLH